MIEILDIRDAEPEKLDITPELAIAAYNTLIQFCTKQSVSSEGCEGCILDLDGQCPGYMNLDPAEWKEIHYPRLIGNTIEYLKDGQIHKITYSDRRDAEKKLEEMEKNAKDT